MPLYQKKLERKRSSLKSQHDFIWVVVRMKLNAAKQDMLAHFSMKNLLG